MADLDWPPDRARAFGGSVLELYVGLLEELAHGPTSPQLTTAGVREAVALDVPEGPLADDALLAHLRTIVDHSLRPGSGGFMAYISGAGTVPGALVDLLASGLNANAGGWVLSPAATEVELQLVRYFTTLFGLPAGAGGNLVNGGSLANLSALKLARDRAGRIRPARRRPGSSLPSPSMVRRRPISRSIALRMCSGSVSPPSARSRSTTGWQCGPMTSSA